MENHKPSDRPQMPGWSRQRFPVDGEPHGWLQWKGTSACMDFHCACGATDHIDADFGYYVKCAACGSTYMMNGHVEAVKLTPEEAREAEGDGTTVLVNTDEALEP